MEHKNWIYWETPKITIWRYTISEVRINEDWTIGDSVWIQSHDENWDMTEWWEFHKSQIENDIKQLFDKYF